MKSHLTRVSACFSISSAVLLLTSGALSAQSAFASEFDLALSDESLAANVRFLNMERSLRGSIGALYREGGSRTGTLEMLATGQTAVGNLPTTVGLGVQLDVFSADNVEGAALPIGGYVQFNIPQVPGLGFSTSGFISPSITSFGDAERFWRIDTKLTYRVIRAADVYLGYRHLNVVSQDGPEVSLDESFHLGFTLQF